ncbi:hypothetical protein L873DRAFT_1638786, partial [Choiromyces venosus 120613-1]
IQAWLSPLKPHIRYQDMRNLRFAGVGDWVLGRGEFKEWFGGQVESGILSCSVM